jgi:hypothetical protein
MPAESGMEAWPLGRKATALALAAVLGSIATPAFGATIRVSNTKDVVNGNTATPTTLRNSPGPDGISLREAIIAANNVAGPHTIAFDAALAGKRIVLSAPLPAIRRNGITISGLKQPNGQPDLTIDGRGATANGPTLFLAASSFTMRWLRFVHTPLHYSAIQIGGTVTGLGAAPSSLSNIRFTGNSFTQLGAMTDGFAIVISMTVGTTNNATVSNVVIDNNSFSDLFEGVNLQGAGRNNIIRDVLIYNNKFLRMTQTGTSAVELGNHDGKNNQILRTRIIQNIFDGNVIGIALNNTRDSGPPGGGVDTTTTGNVIDGTVIERNIFSGNLEAIALVGGVGNGTIGPANNAVSNTTIVNNAFDTSLPGIAAHLIDNMQAAANNQVRRVNFVNNTVNTNSASLGPPQIMIESGGGVSQVIVRNSIFWRASSGGESGAVTQIPAVSVSSSILNQSGYVGSNGNFNANPMFRNTAARNFRLRTGSPALGAASAAGAPAEDADCQPRPNPPAIGAYELNGTNICPASPP